MPKVSPIMSCCKFPFTKYVTAIIESDMIKVASTYLILKRAEILNGKYFLPNKI